MRPRVLFRTHYQIDEPGYIGLILRSCSLPTKGTYPEAVAEKFAKVVRDLGQPINRAAGTYAVDLARGLGVLNEQCSWTEKGHLVNLLSQGKDRQLQEQLEFDDRERFVYFRLFLDADGAVLRFIGQKALEHGQLPYDECTWNTLVREMFLQIYSDYLLVTGDTLDRASLRKDIERLRASEYKGNTGPHKAFIHLQTLCRVGLLERADSAGMRRYRLPQSPDRDSLAIARLIREVPSVTALERTAKNRSWIELAARVFSLSSLRYAGVERGPKEDLASHQIADLYLQVMRTGIPLCPLSTLLEAVQIEMLVQSSILMTFEDLLEHLKGLQKRFPRGVRLHVDRQGRPAYLRMSEAVVSAMLGR